MNNDGRMKDRDAPEAWRILDTTQKRLLGLTEMVNEFLTILDQLETIFHKKNRRAHGLLVKFATTVTEVRERTSDTAPFSQFMRNTARAWRAEETEAGSQISKKIALHQQAMQEGERVTKATEVENGKLQAHIQAVQGKIKSCQEQKERQCECLSRCDGLLQESDEAVRQMKKILRDMAE